MTGRAELPDPVLEEFGRFLVVRDDKLAGGSKMRYVLPLVSSSPANEFVYASPAFGYAQIALAHCCAMVGKRATIFTAQRKVLHPRTRRAQDAGAKIVSVPNGYLAVVQARAREYANESGAVLVPHGVADHSAIAAFTRIVAAIPIKPKEVWSCAGSGTLSRALQIAWPRAKFFAVQVGGSCDVGRATLYKCALPFEKPSRSAPPFPSCDNYDAKAWDFMLQHGADNALFWNVGA
jgi:cysteine synthase